jgi:hypothetical protein
MHTSIARRGWASARIRVMLATVALCAALLTAALMAGATPASADIWEGTLPGGDWQTNGDVFNVGWIYAYYSGSSDICVGPVQHNSEGYKFPYGWDCAPRAVEWRFTNLSAAGAVYNPNSGSEAYDASDSS